MQFRQQPQSMLWKIAFLIIALVGDVSCIRNGDGNDEQRHISAKLKNFFPSEPLPDNNNNNSPLPAQASQTSARVTNGGFRPSQMLEFTPSDVMHGGTKRYPPSYLEPNYKHHVPNTLANLSPQQSAMDKQFAFPDEPTATTYHHSFGGSQQIPTTPVVSYLDPFTQQNYRYTPTSPPPSTPSFIQYQREQPVEQGDQAYTVQSSLLVGNHSPQQQHQTRPGHVEDVYLKRPGYVFDESPSSAYRRPAATTAATTTTAKATSTHKISYDSHDYPPPSYATQQTSNFVPQSPQPQAPRPPRPTPPSYRPTYNRQDVNDNRPLAGPSIHEASYASQPQFSSPSAASYPSQSSSSSSSNYANNFGNYLQRPTGYPSQSQSPSYTPNPSHYQYESLVRPQQYQQQQQQQQQYQRPGHNYYQYQIGEIPPQQQQQQQQFNYRPAPAYHPPTQSTNLGGGGGGGGGLATLASLLSSTQQYAPQFTNLLLGGAGSGGGFGGGGGGASTSASPLGSLLGAFTGQQQHSRPPTTQLIRALENIARNDDLQCVPKVLCQMIAGQTLRGQLPGFITSPAITNFLAGFPAASPALIYGRAALLGISGGERSCIRTYEQCPKNEMEIIHYLNNHRGGFFKFFSEPEEQTAEAQQSESGGGSLFSILSALTGGGGVGGGGLGQVTRTTPRPVARPTQRPSTDIADGIGSFFTRVLSEYLNGVEYERRRRRRRRSLLPTEIKRSIQTDNERLMAVDFHDEEDDLDTQTPVKFQDDDEAEAAQAHTELIGVLQFPEDAETEGRILHFKDIASEEHHVDGAVRFPDATPEAQVIHDFNRNAAQRKLRFPQEPSEGERQAKQLQLTEGWRAVLPNGLGVEDYGVNKRRGKRIVFKDNNEQLEDLDERLREEQEEEDRRLREEAEEQQRLRAEEEERQRHRAEEEEQQRLREEAEEDRRQRAEEEEENRQREYQREKELRNLQLQEEQRKQQHTPLNALYEQAAPPQRGARVIFPDHYERHIRRGKILNKPTYAPSYDYHNEVRPEEHEQQLVVSDEHRPTYYRIETADYQANTLGQNFMNYGEYLPGNSASYMPGNTVRFVESLDRPQYNAHYNYPNTNYISDNRYSSAYQASSTRRPKHEDDKNIYINNSQGVTEYYIRPDGRKVYLASG
ncbi:uncharacterized protein LOC132792882 [Drosophila nasuta]|uniref:uncharacterized protein LOC132792882 n=1 Tax=Drosophila nasuta TaxID=42062 RepID=UPI00295EA58F|nr:uncharacterized protein LOC132792882 [Drosophila nasuta]